MMGGESQGRRVFAGMMQIAGGTMLSRVAGFALLLVITYYYGAGRDADIFWMSFAIANLFRNVVAERAVESAFLPTFKGMLARSQDREAWRLASSVFHMILLGSAVLALVLALVAPWVVKGMAYGYSAEEQALTTAVARVLMPFLVLTAVAAFLGALLLAFGRFTWYGAAPTLFGVGSVVGVVVLYPVLKPHGQQVYALAFGALLGGLLQAIVQVPVIFSRKVRSQSEPHYDLALDTRMPELRQVGWLLIPILFSAGIEKMGTVVDRTLASGLEEGSVSALVYAFRVVSLPFALVGLGLGRSVLPMLSEQAATSRMSSFRTGVVLSLKYSVLLLVPATVVMVVLPGPMVEVLFKRGEFAESGVRLTSLVLWCYAVGLIPMVWVSNLSRCFHALRDTRTPLIAGGIGLAVNVGLNFVLVRTPLRVGGLALATSISMFVYAGLMLWLLARVLNREGHGLDRRAEARWWVRASVAAAACFAFTLAARWLSFPWISGEGFMYSCVRLALPAAVGGIGYGAAAWLLGLLHL